MSDFSTDKVALSHLASMPRFSNRIWSRMVTNLFLSHQRCPLGLCYCVDEAFYFFSLFFTRRCELLIARKSIGTSPRPPPDAHSGHSSKSKPALLVQRCTARLARGMVVIALPMKLHSNPFQLPPSLTHPPPLSPLSEKL